MRVEKTIKNLVYSYVFKVISLLLNFVVRIVFVKFLAVEYLGASGLFSNILTVLSFAELGIGSAITFCLYKPLEENNQDKLKTLINLFKKCYLIIAMVVAFTGLCCIPFLDVLTNHSELPNLKLIYILYLSDTVISYFGADKQSLLIADQKRYLVTKNTTIIQLTKSIIQVIFIILTKNFLVYLLIQVICQLLTVLYLKYTANKEYPFLKTKEKITPLPKEEKQKIITDVKALLMHKIGTIAINNTDNIIISSFLGLTITGIASNYVLIINSVNIIIWQISYSTLASVGNLLASDVKKDYVEKIFNRLDFLNYSLYLFATVLLSTLLKPLIGVLGKEFGLEDLTVLFLCINFMIAGSRAVVNQFKETGGLFVYDKYKALCEAAINLVVSIWLVQKLGLLGVYIGTFACYILVGVWWEQKVLFNKLFQKSFFLYNLQWIRRFLLTVSLSTLLIWVRNSFDLSGLIGFIIMGFIDLIVISIVYYVFYHKKDEYQYFKDFIFDKFIHKKKL